MKLVSLSPGDKFEIPFLRDTVTNLVVLRVRETGVLVRGLFRPSINDNFVKQTIPLAGSTNVELTGHINLSEPKDSEYGVPIILEPAEYDVMEKRGRKRQTNTIEWPEEPFSFKELAEKLGVEYHTVANAFNRERDKFIEVEKRPNGGRGKPISIWMLKPQKAKK